MSSFKSSLVRIFAAFAAVGIVCLQADATVIDGSVFRYQMSIKPASGMVTTTLANFPVLVRLSAEKLENFVTAQCGENGADIRFALADGTLLAHEIDFWNANGESTVWVNVPSLTNGTEIVAYWSLRNGKTAPAVTASDTWPNFVAVYHFSEATGAISDSSANHYASTNALATVSNTTAKVGLSRNMAGDRFKTGVTNLLSSSAAKPIATVSKFTVSGWMKETTGVSAGYRTLFNKGASPVGWYQSTQNNLTQMTASGSGTTRNAATIPSGASIYSQWCYFIMAYDGGTVYHYINGSSLGGKTTSAVTANTTYELSVSGSLTGMIDEMRIQDGVVSSAWAAADYASQATTTFLDYGEVTAKNPPFTIEAIPTQTYLGAAVEPAAVVKDVADGHVLTNGTDYTVSFDLNGGPGNGRVTVTGVPGTPYADGLLNASFEIVNGPWHVTDYSLGTEGHGFTWGSPVSLSNAVARALAGDTILCKAGTYITAKCVSFSQALTIRGGYAGTDDSTLAEAPYTVLDMTNTTASTTAMSLSNASGSDIALERLVFRNARTRGFYKSGAGNLTFDDCQFVTNGVYAGSRSGKGLLVENAGSARITLRNSLFRGNRINSSSYYDGTALYLASGGVCFLENCDFVNNGLIPLTPNVGAGNANQLGEAALPSAIRACFPVHAKGCRFMANFSNARNSADGGTVRVQDSAGGSTFTNCLWAGNVIRQIWNTCQSETAALAIKLSTTASKVDVVNCTFAYNLGGETSVATGINLMNGTLNLANSVFVGNRASKSPTFPGTDLNVNAGSVCHARYTVFEKTGTGSVTIFDGATYDEVGIIRSDAKLVTPLADMFSSIVYNGNFPYYGTDEATLVPKLMKIDTHVLSTEGYLSNGVWRTASVLSPAIDAGDPAMSVGDEHYPNGGTVNAGWYGGTAEASKTPFGIPAVTAASVEFFETIPRPSVVFAVGGEGEFTATAVLDIYTNGVKCYTSEPLTGLQKGTVVTNLLNYIYIPGDSISVTVTITGAGSTASKSSETATVVGTMPIWWQKGGDPTKVVHLRSDAFGTGDGTSWADAAPTLTAAMALVTEQRNELWIANTVVSPDNSPTYTKTFAFKIYGGFDGHENSLSDRYEGTKSSLSGGHKFTTVKVSNSALMEVERMVFERSTGQGYSKTGAGDIAFRDCDFYSNTRNINGNVNGRGLHVTGTAGTTLVALSNCVFRGNGMFTGGGYSLGYGAGAYFSSCKRVLLDDCLFVTNGVGLAGAGGSYGGDHSFGSAVYATAAPLTARNCRFVSNHGTCRENNLNGGAVRLEGNCNGSAFTNCLFAGNSDRCGWNTTTTVGYHGGAVVVKMGDAAYAVDLVNCTIAYNLSDGTTSAGGLNVYKGTVNVKNSIFFGNMVGNRSVSGYVKRYAGDIDVKADGILNLSYSLMTTNTTASLDAAAGGTTNILEGVIYGAPLFVTDNASVRAHTYGLGGTGFAGFNTAAGNIEWLTTINCHIRGKTGYRDETTGETVVFPNVMSPALDAGDRASDYRREPFPNGHRVNLGFYGNTPYATTSPLKGSLLFLR